MADFLTPYQQDILARTVLGEAAGEGMSGMQAVANVIRNRALSGDYPSDPAAVALQPSQFSAWNGLNNGGNNLVNTRSGSGYNNALEAVMSVFGGGGSDPTNGAMFYHTNNISPYWADSVNQNGTTQIGNHVFYNGMQPAPVAPNPLMASTGLSTLRNMTSPSGGNTNLQSALDRMARERAAPTPAIPPWIDVYQPPAQASPTQAAIQDAARRAALSVGGNQTFAGQTDRPLAAGATMLPALTVPGTSNIQQQREEQLMARQGAPRDRVYPNATQLEAATGFRVPNMATQPGSIPKGDQTRLAPTQQVRTAPVPATRRAAPVPATMSNGLAASRLTPQRLAPVPAMMSGALASQRAIGPLMASSAAPLRVTVNGANSYAAPRAMTPVQQVQSLGASPSDAYAIANALAAERARDNASNAAHRSSNSWFNEVTGR